MEIHDERIDFRKINYKYELYIRVFYRNFENTINKTEYLKENKEL